MGDQFKIQIPYNVILNPNNYLDEINGLLADFCHEQKTNPWQFAALYSLSVNTETGKTRVEGKVKTDDGRLEINDFEMPWALEGIEFGGTVTHPRYVRLYTISQCIDNVVGWSTARGILENGAWFTQVTKFYEEDGESATGISKNKKRLIMDGLGDALVVLVNIVALAGGNPKVIGAMLQRARERIETDVPAGDAHRLYHKMHLSFALLNELIYQVADAQGATEQGAKKLQFGSAMDAMFEEHLLKPLWFMEALARAYDITLEQCFSLAWDEIKDRKGYLNADGIFIKEADA